MLSLYNNVVIFAHYLTHNTEVMNKIFKQLTGSLAVSRSSDRRVKTSGKLFDWCQEQLKPMGLHIDESSPKILAVYREGDVVGFYNTLTEIKAAIKNGTVADRNL